MDQKGTENRNLTLATAPPPALICREGVRGSGIVHLGFGNFHRAHLAIYTAKAVAEEGGDWGIIGYSHRSSLRDVMQQQDFLYSVIELSPNSEKVCIPAIHTEILSDENPWEVVDAIAMQSIRIVSLTITEAGYCINQRTGDLDVGKAELAADLSRISPPKTAIAQVAFGLLKRAKTHGEPIAVMSCDNVAGNGDVTRQAVLGFAKRLSDDFDRQTLLLYVNRKVSFPNSMVDRIVPRTTRTHKQIAAARLGVKDQLVVPAEEFTMWIIEDDFIAGRPNWDRHGAVFTDEVAAYEVLKLRLLNGTHSLIAYLGALSGCETISSSRLSLSIELAARELIYKEYLPTLTIPSGLNIDRYIGDLFSRWGNTVLADKVARVGSDGSMRLPQRITEPVQHHMAGGKLPEFICLMVAAYLACIAPPGGFDPGSYAAEMTDPEAISLRNIAASSVSYHQYVRKVFKETDIFSKELAKFDKFVERIGDYLEVLCTEDVKTAVEMASNVS